MRSRACRSGSRRSSRWERDEVAATAEPGRGRVRGRGSRLAPRTPWLSARWCAVDLELSGLDPRHDEIVSFAAVPIERGRIPLGSACEGLVRPSRPPAERSVRIHGLRAADLRDAPPLADAIEPLLETIAGSALVAHVARVERAFLGRALRAHGLRLRAPIADTSVIGAAVAARTRRPRAGGTPPRRAREGARPPGAHPARRALGCAHHGPGVHRGGNASGRARRRDGP